MKTNLKPLARKEDIVVQEVKGETLIYDLNSNKAVCLNKTSDMVWQLSNGKNTVSRISEKMSRILKTLINEDLVWLALEQLDEDGLLKNDESIGAHFAGMSRREVIRKVGFTSLVALPIVTSIVAPMPVAAQSGVCDVPACTTALGGSPFMCFAGLTNLCPAACTACTIDFEQHFGDTMGTCPGVSATASTLCTGPPASVGNDTRVTAVT